VSTYHISQTGKDSGLGSVFDPWHSIQYGLNQLSPGDTLVLEAAAADWTFGAKMSGAQGSWESGGLLFRDDTVDFLGGGAAAGDYVFAYDPISGQYASHKVSAVDQHTLLIVFGDGASGEGTATDRSWWLCTYQQMPPLALSPDGLGSASGEVIVIDLGGAVLDGNNAVANIFNFNNCLNVHLSGQAVLKNATGAAIDGVSDNYRIWIEGIQIHSCQSGLILRGAFFETLISGVEVHDCDQYGMAITLSGAGKWVIGCHLHDNGWYGLDTLNETGGIVVADNLIHGNGVYGVHCQGRQSTVFAGNVITGNARHGLVLNGDFAGRKGSVDLFNNIIWGNNTSQGSYYDLYNDEAYCPIKMQRNNCIGTYSGTGVGLNGTDISQDPQFVDAANGDYRLKASSPCWRAGFANPLLSGNAAHIGAQKARPFVRPARAAVYANATGALAR